MFRIVSLNSWHFWLTFLPFPLVFYCLQSMPQSTLSGSQVERVSAPLTASKAQHKIDYNEDGQVKDAKQRRAAAGTEVRPYIEVNHEIALS